MILFHCLNDSRRSTFQFTEDALLTAEETVWKEKMDKANVRVGEVRRTQNVWVL